MLIGLDENLWQDKNMTQKKRSVLMNLIMQDLIEHMKPVSLSQYRNANKAKLNWYQWVGLKGYVEYRKAKERDTDIKRHNDRVKGVYLI